jgi:hypothetical protein
MLEWIGGDNCKTTFDFLLCTTSQLGRDEYYSATGCRKFVKEMFWAKKSEKL